MANVMSAHAGRHRSGYRPHRKPTSPLQADGVRPLALALLLLLVSALLPVSGWLIGFALGGLAGLFVFRLRHHTGDRYRRLTTPAEEAEYEAEHTPIKGTVLPVGVLPIQGGYDLPVYDPPTLVPVAAPVAKGRPPMSPQDKVKVASAVISWVILAIAYVGRQRVHDAQQIQDDVDSLLGIPGHWNNYGRVDSS